MIRNQHEKIRRFIPSLPGRRPSAAEVSAAESSASESFAAEVSAVVRSGRTSTAEVRPRRTVIFGKYFLAGIF